MSGRETNSKLEELEIELFLEAILRYYGYDFRDYEPCVVRRRIREGMLASRVSTVSRFQDKVLRQPAFLERFLRSFSSSNLLMFADHPFYNAVRTKVVPHLRTYPFVRIWYVGCSTGEEVYSLAVVLQEENIYQRTRIYATDLSAQAVKQARAGSFRSSNAREYEANYRQAGGKGNLSDYLRQKGGRLVVDASLKKNIVFSEHNLATDGSFNEFQMIVCRDILGSFNHRLRERVGHLIYDSLGRFGILAVSATESLATLPYENAYSLIENGSGLYQKNGGGVMASPITVATNDAQRC